MKTPEEYFPTFGELVRIINLGIEEQTYFKDLMRRTWMVYNALCIAFSIKKVRGHLLMSRTIQEYKMELCVVGLQGWFMPGSITFPLARARLRSLLSPTILFQTGCDKQEKNNRQCDHQKLEGRNIVLRRSMH
ncbi:hypothetical protein Tsubulata_005451 [Turnera subulata]|uniref:Uncharacterized protein n=1 Tax=Turnera subulata TaxID=218843 RepID=A0A9Q0GGV7_9ROSI|nr:hypothetical protein Tsubulata_005451 [Turnera subulata]